MSGRAAAITGWMAMGIACTRPVPSSPPPPPNTSEQLASEQLASEQLASEPEPATATPTCPSAEGCADDAPHEPPPAEPPPCPPIPEELLAVTGTIEGLRFTIPSSKGRVDPASFERLDAIAEVLVRHPEVRLEVRAHEDSKTADQHRYMSAKPTQRQAYGVRDYLIHRGVAADRLTAQGYGEDWPLANSDTKEGRALNRRVELVVLPAEGCTAPSAP